MFVFNKVVQGTAFSSITPTDVAILTNCLFCLNKEGVIEKVFSPGDAQYTSILEQATYSGTLYVVPDNHYLLPGFIDLHIHAPQWPQAGLALDKPLYQWLNDYTFPLEAKYDDLAFATRVYEDLVETLLSLGTTTGLYFATTHKESSYQLAHICAQKGQRGLVGKVVMDDTDANPDFYRDASTYAALQDTEDFIKRVQALNMETKQGVYPVVTPRFIPSCTDDALYGLGQLATKYDVHVQSHCSESTWEHGYVLDRFGKTDTEMLQEFGLLGDKSVMAHCGHLTDADAKIFAETGTAVAHCPISNVYFGNQITRVKQLINEFKVDVGLGSDISGGFSPSLYDNIKQTVMVSRILSDQKEAPHSLTLNEAFYLATAGGGEALDLPIGRLAEGYAFDAQVISTGHSFIQEETPLEAIFQKLLYLAQPEHIKEVWVQGNLVHSKKGDN